MKFTVDNSDLPPGLSRLIDLEAAIRLKQLPGDGKSECHECGDLKHTRPLLGMSDSGPAKVEMCRECQAEVVEAELEAHGDEASDDDRMAGLSEEDAIANDNRYEHPPTHDTASDVSGEPTLSDEDLAAMNADEIAAALDAGDLDPARLEGTPTEGDDA